MPRGQRMPELVHHHTCKEDENEEYTAKDRLEAASFQPVEDYHPQNQEKERCVNIDINARKASYSPRPAHPPYLNNKSAVGESTRLDEERRYASILRSLPWLNRELARDASATSAALDWRKPSGPRFARRSPHAGIR